MKTTKTISTESIRVEQCGGKENKGINPFWGSAIYGKYIISGSITLRRKQTRVSLLIFLIVALLPWQKAFSVQLAFPGAEGFGAYAQGGRGGDVYYVTNINNSGAGSLRNGIDSATGPRTIVFAVSGLIQLTSDLSVNSDYMTIAGQTAPGDGICFKDYKFSVNADHVIVRFMRSRLGDNAGQEDDSMSISGGHNIIMDHCSASWSVDEVFSCSTSTPMKIHNITVQWSIISGDWRTVFTAKDLTVMVR